LTIKDGLSIEFDVVNLSEKVDEIPTSTDLEMGLMKGIV
jgi:hypothetical protein